MTDTYPQMHKINELAVELINQLNMYQSNIYAEISYADYNEQGYEEQWYMLRGYDQESARMKASESLAKYHEEHGHETPYDEELKTIAEALKVLQKLVAKGESESQ
jgi:hypothetical protein